MKIGTLFGSENVATFLGFARCTPAEVPKNAVCVLGAPGATPYRSAGAYSAQAPRAIREAVAGYASHAHHYDFDLGGPISDDPSTALFDCGDLPFDDNDFAANRDAIRTAVATILERGATPIVLGGDDSVQTPVLQAAAGSREITVLQIDAHIDWRDEVQGERLGLSSTMRRASELPGVRQIVQVGARAIGSARPEDVRDARAYGAQIFEARTVKKNGVQPVVEAVAPGRPVLVCIDVDGLDPSIVPGVIGPAPGGLDYTEVLELLTGVAARAPILGLNVVEFVPENDNGLGALVAARLAILGIGLSIRSRRA